LKTGGVAAIEAAWQNRTEVACTSKGVLASGKKKPHEQAAFLNKVDEP